MPLDRGLPVGVGADSYMGRATIRPNCPHPHFRTPEAQERGQLPFQEPTTGQF